MTLRVRVKAATWEAPHVSSYELRPLDGGDLPEFTAGAHIDLRLANGLTRSYSLTNSQDERHRYVIGVQRDRASRGGSKWLHENLRIGDIVAIDGLRNHFALEENAAQSLLIAGGIGITPILCMVRRLSSLQRSWRLVYCARKRADAAFVEDLAGFGRKVTFNFDEEPGGQMLDLAAVVRDAPPGAHLYCCGPAPMLAAFEAATAQLPPERIHVEYFGAKGPAADAGGLTVVLARSGREFVVPHGKSILETLLDAGMDVAHSCTQGVCGACETKVLEGVPDHRDLVLTEAEQASGATMMICCSGAKSERLVLDL